MCGIAGSFGPQGTSTDALTRECRAMLDAIVHRGPDDSGIWRDDHLPMVLGHQRLSIVELSEAGHQPMSSRDKRFTIVFNGEIYNHLELRSRLQQEGAVSPSSWRGNSDTETLLGCITAWGLEAALRVAVGMFALALWDAEAEELTLARDRLGEKPLYYGWQAGSFLFGSELKALRAHSLFRASWNWEAACSFLRFNYVPGPHSIYEGVYKLPAGTFLRLSLSELSADTGPLPTVYWSLAESALRGQQNPFRGSFDDAVDQLEGLIRNAVQLQAVADVPVGAFLSGGVDSSLVVAMMRSAARANVMTFSIGMSESELDESRHAEAVAAHIGTNHTALRIQPSEALSLIPRLPEIWDEPLGDSSQIPTYIVSRLARQHVTVALSGDGGDEFFLGYAQHALGQSLWKWRALGHLPVDGMLRALRLQTRSSTVATASRRLDSLLGALRQPDPGALGRYLADRYRDMPVPLASVSEAFVPRQPVLRGAAETIGLGDAGTYLPDDILVKVDRAAMANSLETRAPLLDHRVVEFALRLPQRFKLQDGIQKRILKSVLYRQVPRTLIDRPKMGFAIPMAKWLREELRDWAQSCLTSLPANSSPLDRAAILRMWNEHTTGQRDHTERLWGVLSLLAFMGKP